MEKTDRNIRIAGIITIKHGQLTQAIPIIIPTIMKPIKNAYYAKRKIFASTESVSFDILFIILPYGVVSKKDNFVLSTLFSILL